jgi:hypothetical protein
MNCGPPLVAFDSHYFTDEYPRLPGDRSVSVRSISLSLFAIFHFHCCSSAKIAHVVSMLLEMGGGISWGFIGGGQCIEGMSALDSLASKAIWDVS